MKILLPLFAFVLVGCGKSNIKGNGVDGETFVHGADTSYFSVSPNPTNVSVQLKNVGHFTWHPPREEINIPAHKLGEIKIPAYFEQGNPAHFRLKDKKGDFICNVISEEEISKVRKFIGKD